MNLDIKQALKMYNISMLENSFGGILSNKSNLQEEFEYKMPNIVHRFKISNVLMAKSKLC